MTSEAAADLFFTLVGIGIIGGLIYAVAAAFYWLWGSWL